MNNKKFFNVIIIFALFIAFISGGILGYKKSNFDNLSLNQSIGNTYGNPFINQEK